MSIPGWEWMDVLAGKLAGLAAQVNTDEHLPGSIMPDTIVITAHAGEYDLAQGGLAIGLHSVRVVYYGAVGIEPSAYGACRAIIKPLLKAVFASITLDGAVQHVAPDPRAARLWEGPGTVVYGDKNHTGVVVNLEIKERNDAAFSVAA